MKENDEKETGRPGPEPDRLKIDEKDWREAVKKAAASTEEETKAFLGDLFSSNRDTFCLLKEEDFIRYLNAGDGNQIKVIQEDYIIRRRMRLDRGFIVALLKLDQLKVRAYLMEKIVLVRKENDV